ncbi:hypothetical protein N7508_006647 [Penicillium antarcticum]|uniref:uncharacterized protein n=1 Tax=Penicillium antarcticum TaxID=416450 RepID=UPI00239071FA|nr:uncharacterized protein N7508_006647 [Penicillium antarcticum]KAJ5301784.1 hypothetical protein N7508_006647 [Penicillium antarcticum]
MSILTAQRSCLSCHSRKVRCDRVAPQCSPCKKRGLECEMPDPPPRLLWLRPLTGVHEDPGEDFHARRELLFGKFCNLASSTGENSIVSIVEEIDQQSENISFNQILSNGPFHIFQNTEMQPAHLDTLSEILGPEFWDTSITDIDLLAQDRPDELISLEIPNIISFGPELQTNSLDLPVFGEFGFLSAGTPAPLSPQSISCGESPADLTDFALSTAKELLGHYRETLVAFFTPARVESQSPWETMYIPSVFSTVGEIGLSGNSSNAKVSLLFAIFAISAFSLDGLNRVTDASGSQDWRALGEMYRERAKRRLKRSLKDLSYVIGRKKEKYKDILMALLSMVTICVVSGNMRNAAHYLSVIEKIINLHGMRKVARSSKVRMLHSIYLYLRVLTERACADDQQSEPGATEHREAHLDSSFSQLANWDQILGFPSSMSSSDASEFDIIPSHIPYKSAFEEIYSVPQSLFKLILQTTQLAKHVQKLESVDRSKLTDHDALAIKVKNDLEYHRAANTPQKEEFPYHLVQAVQKALFIYFYRCIRDLNPATLQLYVRQTVYHLLEYDKQKQNYKDQSSNTCWPGFIAGCEAQDPHVREEIANWLDRSGHSTGIRMFTVAREAVQKVWQTRSYRGMESVPWNQVLDKYSDLRVLVLS